MHQPEDILHKELESKVAMLKHKKLEVMQLKRSEDQKHIRTSGTW